MITSNQFVNGGDDTSMFLIVLLIFAVGLGVGSYFSVVWYHFAEGYQTLQIVDQAACGNDKAIHVWRDRTHRLVVCSTPSGLVVREVVR